MFSTGSASIDEPRHEEEATNTLEVLETKICRLKTQIEDDRKESVKERVKRNGKTVQCQVSAILSSISRRVSLQTEQNSIQLLSSRINHPQCKYRGISQGLGEKEDTNDGNVSPVTSIKIPYLEKIPPYTTWVYLARNQKMGEDQSVIGRIQLYYDEEEGETVLVNDSDEELLKPKETKHDISEGENQFIWMAFEEHGLTEDVSSILSDVSGRTISEIQEIYKNLKEENMKRLKPPGESESESDVGICLEKSLSASLDPFDKLFCRQCLVYDCRLHDSSQFLIFPSEKQPVWSEPEGAQEPCSDQCYLQKERSDYVTSPFTTEVDLCIDLNSEDHVLEGSTCNGEHDNSSNLRISDWKPFEKDLYSKGVEIFGRNSCLISRNLLCGLKTCMEVASYMFDSDVSIMDKNDEDDAARKGQKMSSRSQRKKGKAKKFRYSSKTAGLPSTRKRIVNKNFIQYRPCGCQGMCGNQCHCIQIGTCCEKYCGCSKLCRNRFRGCHCAKGQCRNRQCPCFAAERECDPDVCRNCWVSCGDGSLEEPPPPRHGDGQCGNMRLRLRQNQKILLAKSDVAGWGAFVKNQVNKNDFLGEYTGEMITHSEADERGKLYVCIDISYVFNLNDQFVLDAFRQGSKLKFANHSPKPNCYAKEMLVDGDHRVCIFADERIEAGEEIFYDYNYNPDVSPAWALIGKSSGSDESKVSRSKAKKHAS